MSPAGRKTLSFVFLLLILFSAVLYNHMPRNPRVESVCRTLFDNDDLTVTKVGEVDRMAVAWIRSGVLYANEDHFVYRLNCGSSRFDRLGSFSKESPSLLDRCRDCIARMKIVRNIRRNFGANNLVVLESGTILVSFDRVYRSDDEGRSFRSVFHYDSSRVSTPFLHGITTDGDDNVYFGEYDCSKRPHRIRIYRGAEDGRRWSIFHEFPPGEVFHVHSVKYDPYRDRLWVCTGDTDEESGLYYFEKGDGPPVLLGGGDQGWRIVSLIPTEDCLYWCSDNTHEGSRIYRYDLAKGEREEIRFIGKPCYDSMRLSDGTLVFSTVYEPGSQYSAEADVEATADIWVSRGGSTFYRILTLAGEVIGSEHGERRPRILFPQGDESAEYLYFTPQYTENHEFSVQVFAIDWKSLEDRAVTKGESGRNPG